MSYSETTDIKMSKDVLKKLKLQVWNLFNCERYCSICFVNTSNLRQGDTVYNISCGGNLCEKSLNDILSATLGRKILSFLPTCYFCESCIDAILKAFKMLEEIKFNHSILLYYVNKLTEQSQIKLPDDAESIVFQLDYPENLEDNSNENSENRNHSGSDANETHRESNRMSRNKSEHVEPKNINNCKSKEINAILAKIKDQITFKKVEVPKPLGFKEAQKDDCTKNVAAKRLIKRTMIDKRNRYYKCSLCGNTFTGEREMLIHSKKLCIKNHFESGKEEVCNICGKIVAPYSLSIHKKLHEEMQRQCPECSQFVNNNKYDRHMLMHTKNPKWKSCPHCDYQAQILDVLDAHINKHHLVIRPYTCDTCKKSFHSKLLLKEHVRIHTRLKTEQCDICGDRFAYKKSLMIHTRIHTGEKPYKCQHCDDSFISSSRRRDHMLTKHYQPNYQCDKCTKRFSLHSVLKKHMAKCHQKLDGSA